MIFDSKFYEQLRQEHKALAKSRDQARVFGGLYELEDIEEFIDFLSEQSYGDSFIPYPVESEEWDDAFELWAVRVEQAPPDNCLEGWAEEGYWEHSQSNYEIVRPE